MVEVSEYHPPQRQDLGEALAEGEYVITGVDITESPRYGPCAIIHTENATYHTFSRVLVKQLTELSVNAMVTYPVKIVINKVKSPVSKRTYLTLV